MDEKRTILHMYFEQGKEISEIAASIPSPRLPPPASICERTVKVVLNEFVTLGEVAPPRNHAAGRRRIMTDAHGRELLSIVEEDPWLFIDEIADALFEKTGTRYHGKYCYEELIRRKQSLKVPPPQSPKIPPPPLLDETRALSTLLMFILC